MSCEPIVPVTDGVREAVVVWWAPVPRVVSSGDLEVLDACELRRVRDAGTPAVAARRAAGYLLARRAVGQVLGQEVADVVLDRTCQRCGEAHGRPRVVSDSGLHLSVTHSGGPAPGPAHDVSDPVVAVAVTRLAPVGIDLVVVAEADFDGFDTVVRHRDDVADADAVSRARLWARKEAVLKAVGAGLDVDPASFPAPRPGTVSRIGPDDAAVALVDLPAVGPTRGPFGDAPRPQDALVGAVALARAVPAVPVLFA
ncbi:4'-phosphopantetheinyl transferase superfamily protein [Terrabacter sp. NPDC080008]|uniref:4'-phosphopantetheinyl transferase family protein n=1 Tax=Terrabacter sp. NPDC080008 TaxID=3155176 RepID=UPI00344DD7B9